VFVIFTQLSLNVEPSESESAGIKIVLHII